MEAIKREMADDFLFLKKTVEFLLLIIVAKICGKKTGPMNGVIIGAIAGSIIWSICVKFLVHFIREIVEVNLEEKVKDEEMVDSDEKDEEGESEDKNKEKLRIEAKKREKAEPSGEKFVFLKKTLEFLFLIMFAEIIGNIIEPMHGIIIAAFAGGIMVIIILILVLYFFEEIYKENENVEVNLEENESEDENEGKIRIETKNPKITPCTVSYLTLAIMFPMGYLFDAARNISMDVISYQLRKYLSHDSLLLTRGRLPSIIIKRIDFIFNIMLIRPMEFFFLYVIAKTTGEKSEANIDPLIIIYAMIAACVGLKIDEIKTLLMTSLENFEEREMSKHCEGVDESEEDEGFVIIPK